MDNELKEFWEKCGFKPITHIQQYPDISTNRPDDIVAWWYPDNDKNYHLPEITLDNLFKYAVPKLNRKQQNDVISRWICGCEFVIGLYFPDNPAETLYQAIKQVILK
jgi:hypothetical protein